MRKNIVTSLALALAACGGPLLGAEIEDPKICIQKPTTLIQGLCHDASSVAGASLVGIDCSKDAAALLGDPAAAAILASVPREADDSGTIPVSDKIPGLDKKGTTGSIHLLSFTVSGSEATLSHLDTFDLQLTGAGEAAPFATFSYVKDGTSYTCDRSTPATCTMTVTVGGTSTDLFARLKAGGDIQYHVALKGDPGALAGLWQDWNASIEACMSAKLTVDALDLINN